MIDPPTWEELSGNPDKYAQLLGEQEVELQSDLSTVRQGLRLVRQLIKVKDDAEKLQRSGGVPSQGHTRTRTHHGPADSPPSPPSPPTRKTRIMNLIAQDPQRLWKVRDVADALGEKTKIKSIRVAMDQLTKSGSLSKLPSAHYQYAHPRET